MEKLKLTLKRVKNTINGSPRYKIINWSDRSLFDQIIENGFIRDLKKGFFTKSDATDNYSIGNAAGFIIDNILILSKIKY